VLQTQSELQARPRQSVWIFNHYAGTATSPSTRHYDLARQLVARGHRVTVFAAGFSYQKLVEEKLGPGERWKQEDHDGVRFIWVRTFPYKKNDWRRVLNMLSYSVRVIGIGRRLEEKPDAIVGSTVHPFAALSAYILSRMKGSRFFFEVRDLWPQSLIDAGAWREHSVSTWALRKLETFLYRKAETIISLQPFAHRYITTLGIPVEKIVFIPNGADLARYEGMQRYDGGSGEPFNIMYLGVHGRMNALDVILEAAGIIQSRGNRRIRFIFVGDGPTKGSLMKDAEKRALKNVEFRDPVPKSDLFRVMNEADAFVFNLDNVPFRYGVSANKLFDYLASGRPVLFAADTVNDPITEAGAGFAVPARAPEQLAEAALRLAALPSDERIAMGNRGQAYLRLNHDIRVIASKFEEVLTR
jgi:glycosyltransferase involved in cell wall biosynthesis